MESNMSSDELAEAAPATQLSEGLSARTSSSSAARRALSSSSRDGWWQRFISERFLLQSIFCLLGVGNLVPWNAFVSAKMYFLARFCQQEDEDGGGMLAYLGDGNMESTFAIVYNVSSVLSLVIILLVQGLQDQCHTSKQHAAEPVPLDEERSPTTTTTTMTTTANASSSSSVISSSSQESGRSRSAHAFYMVMAPLFLYAAVFCGQTVMVLWTLAPPPAVKIFTMASLGLCGICGAIASAGIVATAGLFDAHLGINPYLAGQSAGGVAVSLANFMAAMWEDPHVYWDTHCDVPGANNSIYADDTMSPMLDVVSSMETKDLFQVRYDEDRFLAADDGADNGDGSGNSCVPYQETDWAVFLYFSLGSLVLIMCLLGYAYIDQYQQAEHRDDYETVHDVDHPIESGDEGHESNGDDNLPTTPPLEPQYQQQQGPQIRYDEKSPRTGLEMLESRLSQRSRDNDLGTEDSQQQLSECKVTRDVERANSRDHLLPDDGIHESRNTNETMTNPSSSRRARPSLHTPEDPDNETVAVWMHVKGPAFCIFLNFVVTLAIFPGWTSELRSQWSCRSLWRLANDLYTPWSFFFFNCGDLLGRILSAYVPIQQIKNLSSKLVWGGLLRFLFFPLFMMCLAGKEEAITTSGHHRFIGQIQSDIYSGLVQLGFAVTNGLLVSLAFAHAPSTVPATTHVQERMSEFLTLSLYLGLLVGSFLSFPVIQFVN